MNTIAIMNDLLLLAESPARIWYAIPLIVVISLVYGGTRHEYLREIFEHAFRSGVWMVSFMLMIFAIIWVSGYGN